MHLDRVEDLGVASLPAQGSMLPPDLIAKLNECAKTNFIGARDVWFFRQSIFSWAVIGGLVLEGPELIYDILSLARTNIRRFRYSIILLENRVELAKVAAFVGWIFIIVGLFGELKAGSKIADLSASIQGCSDAKVQAATLEAGDAATSAKTAREEAYVVGKETDAIQKRLDSASRQLSEVEQQVRIQGPRRRQLEDNRDKFLEAIKPFAGQRVTVVKCGYALQAEPEQLEQYLLNLLGVSKTSKPNAGWMVESPGYATWAKCNTGASAVGGNLVIVSSTADGTVKVAATALYDALNRIDISTVQTESLPEARQLELQFLGDDSPWELAIKDPTAVIILIGTNPMFDLSGWHKRHK